MSHANNHRAEHQRLKYTHAQLFAEVSRILVRHDPIGLIALGAPDDEYEPEVSTILPRLREADSVDDLQRIIHQEFVSWFSDEEVAESEVHYAAIAEDVWAVWQRYVQKPGEHAEWA